MSKIQPLTLRRIQKELLQFKVDPPDGISIVATDSSDILSYLVNIKIQSGPYAGAIAHCKLDLNQDHPQTAPNMYIFWGAGFENSHHHHLLHGDGIVRFCIDILSNAVLSSTTIGSGWNPAYTLKTLLMQIQNFIADPDAGGEISQSVLLPFRKQNYEFTRTVAINGHEFQHGYSSPYPPFLLDTLDENLNLVLAQRNESEKAQDKVRLEQKQITNLDNQNEVFLTPRESFGELQGNEEKKENFPKLSEEFYDCNESNQYEETKENPYKLSDDFIKGSLTCYMCMTNPIDDPEEIFGLPIFIEIDPQGRLQSCALTETLSFAGYEQLIASSKLKKPFIPKIIPGRTATHEQNMFKSSTGELFNCWLPFYLNEYLFHKNLKIIEKSISVMSASSELGFRPFMVLEVIPNLINKMFVKIFDTQSGRISSVAIQAYLQMFQLLLAFCRQYPQIQEMLDKKVFEFASSDFNRNKKVIGDFGEFFVVLSASQISFGQQEFLDLLYREQSARQMLFLENNEEFMIKYSSSFAEGEQQDEECYKKRMMAVWEENKIGHNLLVFTIEASKYLTNRQFLSRIAEESYSLVSDNFASHFTAYTRRVRELITNHRDFLCYLGLGDKYDTFEKVHEVFLIGIYVSNCQGYTRKRAEIDEKLLNNKPNLKHFSVSCTPLKRLLKKNNLDNQEKELPQNLSELRLEDVMQKDLNNKQITHEFISFDDNKLCINDENQRKSVFKQNTLNIFKNKDHNFEGMQHNLSETLKDQKEEEFVDKMRNNVGHGRTKLSMQPPGKEWEQLSKFNISAFLKKEVINPAKERTNPKDFYNFTTKDDKKLKGQWRRPENPAP